MWRQKLTIYDRLVRHLRCETECLPVVSHVFDSYELANIQLSLDKLFSASKHRPELFGAVSHTAGFEPTLANLVNARSAGYFSYGPVSFADVSLANGSLSCVQGGLYLWVQEGQPLAILVRTVDGIMSRQFSVEVLAKDRKFAELFLAELKREVNAAPALRGHVLSVESDHFGNLTVQFHDLPDVEVESIVLPGDVLAKILRHTVQFSKHAAQLKAMGRHLKRGLLLHGPPGTGKTMCAMHVARQMQGCTVLLVTGSSVMMIENVCRLARRMTPAMVVLEDVDLMGSARDTQSIDANGVLFKLLNQMDGLASDADLLFVLTTNRPDALEPALAARPGRIDQTIEVPLPNADCRRQLLERYCRGLSVEGVNWQRLVDQLQAVNAALIRELVRRAALLASIDQAETDKVVVYDKHFQEALDELMHSNAINRRLLGFAGNASAVGTSGSLKTATGQLAGDC